MAKLIRTKCHFIAQILLTFRGLGFKGEKEISNLCSIFSWGHIRVSGVATLLTRQMLAGIKLGGGKKPSERNEKQNRLILPVCVKCLFVLVVCLQT